MASTPVPDPDIEDDITWPHEVSNSTLIGANPMRVCEHLLVVSQLCFMPAAPGAWVFDGHVGLCPSYSHSRGPQYAKSG